MIGPALKVQMVCSEICLLCSHSWWMFCDQKDNDPVRHFQNIVCTFILIGSLVWLKDRKLACCTWKCCTCTMYIRTTSTYLQVNIHRVSQTKVWMDIYTYICLFICIKWVCTLIHLFSCRISFLADFHQSKESSSSEFAISMCYQKLWIPTKKTKNSHLRIVALINQRFLIRIEKRFWWATFWWAFFAPRQTVMVQWHLHEWFHSAASWCFDDDEIEIFVADFFCS